MKQICLLLTVLSLYTGAAAQHIAKKQSHMKLNAGILTTQLAESKIFYTEILGLQVAFENDFYLLLQMPDGQSAISFLLPDHPSQQPLFHKPFTGQGMYLTIEVDDVDQWYRDVKAKAVKIEIELRDEPWGDRHFAIKDPNGIGVDIVHYAAPEKQ